MIKALELACMLEKSCGGEQHILDLYKDRVHIAAELRRLHELNAELVAVLNLNYGHAIGGKGIKTGLEFAEMIKRTEALLAKAKEQMACTEQPPRREWRSMTAGQRELLYRTSNDNVELLSADEYRAYLLGVDNAEAALKELNT